MLVELMKLFRPRQWVKNLFVFIPLLFSKMFLEPESIVQALIAFCLFCIAASATYVLNDLRDIEKDRMHPQKSVTRPLAAGTISPVCAKIALFILYMILAVATVFVPSLMAVIAAYIVLNYVYTFFLKHEPVFDVFVIALGFVLRVYAGGIAINSGVSNWMFVVTLCLALYLACVKRRQELIKSGDSARIVLGKYSVSLLTQYAEMAATCTIVFYSLFIALVKPELVMTIPLMLFGLFRYWYCVDAEDVGESPTDALLNDRVLQATLLLWAGLTAWSLTEGIPL